MGLKVGIIGGGPSGAATARALLAETPSIHIELFESRPNFGGVWNYSPISGPMYYNMDANVPRDLISYADFPFRCSETYPTRSEVLTYLQNYALEITRSSHINVRFNTTVVNVRKIDDQWSVILEDGDELHFDCVVLATGHYQLPYWPPIPNLKHHRGAIHSIDYDRPEEFADTKVLIIGNARSATDLAIQLLSVTHPLTISRRRIGPTDSIFEEVQGSVIWKPQITHVDGDRVFFEDQTNEQFDRIIVSTGYLYEFPYLILPDEASLHHKSRLRLQNIYKHTFYMSDPTLATLAINKGIVPFPTMEAQAAVIARVWNNRLSLPSYETMKQEEEQIAAIHGKGDKFHELNMQQDLEFINELWDWADKAPGGFSAERWSSEKIELRRKAGSLKEAHYRQKLIEARVLRNRRNTRSQALNL